ncbi:MAG: hypothetical protein HY769_09870, partial [Candidatus Stahlbacteria bacterium]|nr:hypothetical protein [Candidatus Stahlbacteria bacterium]
MRQNKEKGFLQFIGGRRPYLQLGVILIPLIGAGIVYYLLGASRGSGISASLQQVRGNHQNHKVPIVTQQVIKDDWLVNDDTLGGCDQTEAIITSTKTLHIVAWIDYRNGSNPDIYIGMFDFNGLLLGEITRVNDDTGSKHQSVPSIDADSMGNFIIVWEDKRNGGTDIYAQRYSHTGLPMGNNFKVNDDTGGKEQYTPSVAVAKNGKAMIVWRDDRGFSPDIYTQIYDENGGTIGANFVVNDDGLANPFQVFPAVSKAPNNEFAVVWLDTRAGIRIYGQRYTENGTIIGTNFRVTDNADSTAPMRFPVISSNGTTSTIVVWRDHRQHDSYPNIYTQVYDSLWDTVGCNFKVNNDGLKWHDVPNVIMDSIGNFVIAWSDERLNNIYPDVYAQIYDPVGDTIGTNFKVNTISPLLSELPKLAIGVDSTQGFIVLWQTNADANTNILAQIYTSDGSSIGNNFNIIPDNGTSNQQEQEIAMNTSGKFVIAWEDERGSKPCIFVQQYQSNGNPVGINFQINATNRIANSPSVDIDSAGNFVVVWTSPTDKHIYARKYSRNGIPQTTELQVDIGPNADRLLPSVAMDWDGNFVVVWQDYRNDSKCCNIFGQRYNNEGIPIDSNFKIDQFMGESNEEPYIDMDADGDFIVVWHKGTVGMPMFDIYGQRFNSSGDTVGVNFQISDDPITSDQQMSPSVAIHDEGNFVVVWQDSRNHTSEIYDIYAQVYDALGVARGMNFKVNTDTGNTTHTIASVALHSLTKSFIVAWTDYRETNPQIIAQECDSLGTLRGEDFQINNPGTHLSNYHLSSSRSLGVNEIQVAIAWTDNRRLKGRDIYAKLIGEVFEVTEAVTRQDAFIQIYPTPAIKQLIVKYRIPYSGDNQPH